MAATHVCLITSEPRRLRCVTCVLLAERGLGHTLCSQIMVSDNDECGGKRLFGRQRFGKKKKKNSNKTEDKKTNRSFYLCTETVIMFCRIKAFVFYLLWRLLAASVQRNRAFVLGSQAALTALHRTYCTLPMTSAWAFFSHTLALAGPPGWFR